MCITIGPDVGPGNITVPTNSVLIQNNVCSDISSTTWGGHGFAFQAQGGNGAPTPAMYNIIIDHNTAFEDQTAVDLYGGSAGDVINNVQLTNNLLDYGVYGIYGDGVGSGTIALTTYLNQYIYNDIVFSAAPYGSYPTGTLWSTNIAGVGFTSVSGTDPNISGTPGTGNLQLTSGSAYHNAGTDGNDIGVDDWGCYN